ncbi:DUF3857 domain-containing protein [Pseudoduganella sp. SL102]|uniref:DUF3857 domain-containing protein n=1 Tax=Pseudoduganella sp. SL102 TaxID=2995154 RepID=UPI00248C1489|nr:DUF3857 domain-containing protein [Pseudoduganella sp. SL102]WBR99877.1 DUF3857 domain-containing protein [Pseudoduganella sp. SL102]
MFHFLGILLAALTLAHGTSAIGAPGKPAQQQDRSFSRFTPVPAWVLPMPPVPETVRKDAAVIRLADTQVRLDREVSTHITSAIQVNDQQALQAIGQFGIDYLPSYQTLQLHQVAILRDGKTLDQAGKVDLRLLDSENLRGQGMYGGVRTLQMLLPDVRVGDTLLLRYTVAGHNPVFGARWFDTFAWDATVPAEHRRLVITHPRKRALAWRQNGDFRTAAVPVRIEHSGDDERLVFEQRAIDELEWEPGMPPEYQPGRSLQFSEFQDWRAVSEWAAALFPAPAASPGLAALARELSADPSKAVRAAAALRWVQNEVRYFSVAIGENSHRPRAPDAVLKSRFGDCKDKAYLLVSLLRLQGIDAMPVLVSAGSPLVPARLLPSPGAFDHVIVRLTLDGKEHYVDPTATGQVEALEALPVPLPAAQGLLAAPAAAALVTLPPPRDTVDFLVDEAFVIERFDGPATLHARREYRGDAAAAMRRHFAAMNAASLRRHVLELYEKRYPGVALRSVPTLKDYGERYELNAELTLPKPVTLVDGLYELAIENKLVAGTLDIPDKLVRNYPFVPSGPSHGRHTLSVTWPAAARLNDIPGAFAIDGPSFRYRHDYLLRGNVLRYEADYRVTGAQVAPGGMQALHEQATRLAEAQITSFSIGKASLVPEPLQGLAYRAALSATAASKAPTKRPSRNDALDDATLCAAAVSQALAGEYSYDGQAEVATAVRAELARRGNSEEARRCRAILSFMDGAGAQVAAGGFADVLREPDDPLHLYLAWGLLFAGDKAAAVKAASRYAGALESAGTATISSRLRHAALLRRAGVELPDALRNNLAFPVNTGWPAPIGRLLAGETDAAQLLAAAETLTGPLREMALAEAWYYIGAVRLAAADKAGARRAFRQVLATGPRSSIEYQLAANELSAMASTDADFLAGRAQEANERYRAALGHYQLCAARADAECRNALGLLYYQGQGTARDHARAFELFRLAALQGNSDAQNSLGLMYDEGEGVARDPAEGLRWLQAAADNLDAHGLRNMGDRYVRGITVERDVSRGVDYLRWAAALGNIPAQEQLGEVLLGMAPEEAAIWNRLGAVRGDTGAQVRLIDQLRFGKGMPADAKLAFALATPLAEQGDAGAQVQLGMMYESGNGVAEDRDAALRWFRKAAASGFPVAKLRIGLLLMYGDRTPEEHREARRLLEEALAADVHFAGYLLGNMYRDGRGGEADFARAALYYERAAAAGVVKAAEAAGMLYLFKLGDPARAAEWYGKAAEQGYATAINNLGDLYERGAGVAQDLDRAVALYRRAAGMEHDYGFFSLSSLYAAGKGVPRDPVLAFTYHALAVRFGLDSDREAELERQLTPAQAAAARDVAAKWDKSRPLPGM